MKNYFSFYIISSLLFFVSCNKEITELPPSTETGANTFGCKVDGKFWAPAGFGIIPTAPKLEARLILNKDLYLNARNFSSSPIETEFEIFVKDITAPGNYLLNTTLGSPSPTANYGYYVHRKISPDNEWMTTEQYTGTVSITKIDTISHIVSGTFEFRAINLYNTPQPLTVTEGRFDVKTQ